MPSRTVTKVVFRAGALSCLCFGLCASLAAAEPPRPNVAGPEPVAGEGATPQRAAAARQVPVRLLAWNDFHGQLTSREVEGRRMGGAATLVSYLKAAAAEAPRVFFVHAGDQVGASPAVSALLQDEPSIAILNQLANRFCTGGSSPHPRCNVIGTLGNHEFDEGEAELLRLLRGGNHREGPFLEDPWRGARFPHVCANVVRTRTGTPIVLPYVVQWAGGVPIAFLGAVLRGTPNVVVPSGVAGLSFLDEAEAVNRYVPELRARGVRAIVLLIHQGAVQSRYAGPTQAGAAALRGALLPILSKLDPEIDVVVSGHSHEFTNAFVPHAGADSRLVTQAVSAGVAYAEIDLVIDAQTRDVVSKTARIIPTWADEGPGLKPDPGAARIVAQAQSRVAPRIGVVVGTAREAMSRWTNPAGESALGNLIADAQRAAMATDFAVLNPGGIRADLPGGEITWGDVFAAQPFRNDLIALRFTGEQLYGLLNQQWGGRQPVSGRVLQISGFTYTWDSTVPAGGPRVLEIRDARGPIDRTQTYTVAANRFLAEGGDGFTQFLSAQTTRRGGLDLDALVDYLRAASKPISAGIEGRIERR